MRKLSLHFAGQWFALLMLVMHPLSISRADSLRILMASGDAVPYAGAPSMNLTESSFNAQGQVAAVIMVPPTGSSSWESLVVASRPDGSFRVVARETIPLPGAPAGENYISPYEPPIINNQAQVAFLARIYPNGHPPQEFDSYYETLWSEAGGLHLVDVRENEWHHRRFITLKGIADNGNLLYIHGGYSDGSSVIVGDDPELLIEENGSSQYLFKRHNAAPVGCPPGVFCSVQQDFLFGSALNADGTAIYGMQVKGAGITTLNNDVMLRRTAAGTTTLVRDGDPAWGLPSGYRFSHVIAPDSSTNGEIVFQSYIDTPSGTELQYSVFANTGGVERLVARHGAAAPGFGGSRTFARFDSVYATETGRVVVVADLSGTDLKRGVFRESGGQLSLVFESDQPAPGIDGAVLSEYGGVFHDSPATGATILSADWYNSGISLNGTGLWRIEQGNWQLLLTTGQSLEVSPGDVRTINWLNPKHFTASGMLPIDVMFTNGTRALLSWTDAPQRIAGDANGDGKVDAADYVLWRKNIGETVLGGYGADADGNRVIGPGDYQAWRTNFGRASAGDSLLAVPEPGLFHLIVIALAACRIRQSNRSRIRGPRVLSGSRL
jgi:hypothetical protein